MRHMIMRYDKMRHMKDTQRRTMFARLNDSDKRFLTNHPSTYNDSFSQLQKKGKILKYMNDIDKDGVPFTAKHHPTREKRG